MNYLFNEEINEWINPYIIELSNQDLKNSNSRSAEHNNILPLESIKSSKSALMKQLKKEY